MFFDTIQLSSDHQLVRLAMVYSHWLRRCHCLAPPRCAVRLVACLVVITTQTFNDLQEAGTLLRADSGQDAVFLHGVRVHIAGVPLERPLLDRGEDDVEAGLGQWCDCVVD